MLLALVLVHLPRLAGAKPTNSNGRGKVVDVMTRNLYLGADLSPASLPEPPNSSSPRTASSSVQVLDNNFPLRAQGLADEILQTKPDLVGLQEVAFWQTTPISPAGTALTLDYLDLLLDQLNAGKGNGKGKPQYTGGRSPERVRAEAPADVNGVPDDGPPLPESGNDAEVIGKLTMRDVILARQGAGVQTSNEQETTSPPASNCR